MNPFSPARRVTFSALITFIGLSATTVAAVEYSVVQTDKSAVNFVFSQMGVAVNGRFQKFTAQIAFDPARPEAGKVNFSIDLASIDAGSKDADDEVAGKQWFNVRMFPLATFTSSGMRSLGGSKYEAAGPLTIKGKSQRIAVPFSFRREGNGGIFEGSFTVKRIDFAIGEGPWSDVSTIANDVQVSFRVVVAPPAATAKSK